MSNLQSRPEGLPDAETIVKVELKEPRKYQVLLHNDDYTTMEFVVSVLMEIFRKTADQATSIMLAVHQNGEGIAGVYYRQIAETKIEEVRVRASQAGFPLRCTLREVAP